MIVNRLKGIAYRLVLEKYRNKPISGNASLKYGFRYSPPPPDLIRNVSDVHSFKAEYLSDSEQTTRDEVRQDSRPRILFKVEFSFSSLLDLTNTDVVQDLTSELNPTFDDGKFQPRNLYDDWQKINSETGDLAPTQYLGYLLYQASEIEALRVPSVRNKEGYNIVVFIDRLQIGSYLIARNGNTIVQKIDGSLKVK
jgi:hypothetical protein